MNLLRKVFGALLLASVLEVAALACAPPEPGIIETPPCAPTQLMTDEPTVLNQLETTSGPETFDLSSTVEELLITLLLF